MPQNKRQHYIPQFYMKGFSPDTKNIHIFNIFNSKMFYGPIKTACAESYFFSKEADVEKALAALEGKTSEIFDDIKSNVRFPTSAEDYVLLLASMLDQRGRTAAARDSVKRHTQHMSDIITEGLGVTGYKIVWKGDHMYSMLGHMAAAPLIADLKPMLLINQTDTEFITSDHPVIFHNPKFNHLKNQGVCGFASRGLQIFWPITPSICLFLYDTQYYQIDSDSDQVCNVSSDADIFSINALQYLYCRENVLFSSEKTKEHIGAIDKRFKPIRIKEREVHKTHPHMTKQNAELVQFYRQTLDFSLELSFIKILDGPDYGARDVCPYRNIRIF